MSESDQLAAEFEKHRGYLRTIAFRMLGSHADAEDAVQEAWLRLARTGAAGIDDLRGWLTTVTGRICLDALRRRNVRGEQPLELSIGLLGSEGPAGGRADPERETLLGESVALALHVVMDQLTPAERVAFVLIDGRPDTLMVFAVHAGLITRISMLTDPDRLGQLVPSWVA
jgi:RNA polymerase sigma-70 factor (ECF subfamily)